MKYAGTYVAGTLFAAMILNAQAQIVPDDAVNKSQCVAAYAQNMANVEYVDMAEALLSEEYKRTCNSSARDNSTSFSGNLETLVNSVPVVASWMGSHNTKSNKAFCEIYEKNTATFRHLEAVSYRPIQSAYVNLNQCFDIFQKSNVLVTTSSLEPGVAAFNFRFPRTDLHFELRGIIATGGFKCTEPGRNDMLGRPVVLTENSKHEYRTDFSINCRREPNKMIGDDAFFQFASITLGTSGGNYGMQIAEDTIVGPAKQSKARAEKQALEKQRTALQQNVLALQNEVRAARIDAFPFYTGGNCDLPHGFSGPCLSFYWFNHGKNNPKPESEWHPLVKGKLCPTANRTVAIHKETRSGSCCGYQQYVMVCSWMDPEKK